MKIEKINENQIRCTLTREDLAERELKLSELVYGTEKAKSLFRDMMQQASYEYGFEAEDIPLMIEAIPVSADTIVLVVTKVEYPEELDTRFSQFSQGTMEETEDRLTDSSEKSSAFTSAGADDILDFFRKMQEEAKKTEAEDKSASFIPLDKALKQNKIEQPTEKTVHMDISKMFEFENFDQIIRLSKVLVNFYHGSNVLYKNPISGNYYLIINKTRHTPEDFNKVCNIFSEYARQIKYSSATEAYFEEHYDKILKNHAIQTLAAL